MSKETNNRQVIESGLVDDLEQVTSEMYKFISVINVNQLTLENYDTFNALLSEVMDKRNKLIDFFKFSKQSIKILELGLMSSEADKDFLDFKNSVLTDKLKQDIRSSTSPRKKLEPWLEKFCEKESKRLREESQTKENILIQSLDQAVQRMYKFMHETNVDQLTSEQSGEFNLMLYDVIDKRRSLTDFYSTRKSDKALELGIKSGEVNKNFLGFLGAVFEDQNLQEEKQSTSDKKLEPWQVNLAAKVQKRLQEEKQSISDNKLKPWQENLAKKVQKRLQEESKKMQDAEDVLVDDFNQAKQKMYQFMETIDTDEINAQSRTTFGRLFDDVIGKRDKLAEFFKTKKKNMQATDLEVESKIIIDEFLDFRKTVLEDQNSSNNENKWQKIIAQKTRPVVGEQLFKTIEKSLADLDELMKGIDINNISSRDKTAFNRLFVANINTLYELYDFFEFVNDGARAIQIDAISKSHFAEFVQFRVKFLLKSNAFISVNDSEQLVEQIHTESLWKRNIVEKTAKKIYDQARKNQDIEDRLIDDIESTVQKVYHAMEQFNAGERTLQNLGIFDRWLNELLCQRGELVDFFHSTKQHIKAVHAKTQPIDAIQKFLDFRNDAVSKIGAGGLQRLPNSETQKVLNELNAMSEEIYDLEERMFRQKDTDLKQGIIFDNMLTQVVYKRNELVDLLKSEKQYIKAEELIIESDEAISELTDFEGSTFPPVFLLGGDYEGMKIDYSDYLLPLKTHNYGNNKISNLYPRYDIVNMVYDHDGDVHTLGYGDKYVKFYQRVSNLHYGHTYFKISGVLYDLDDGWNYPQDASEHIVTDEVRLAEVAYFLHDNW